MARWIGSPLDVTFIDGCLCAFINAAPRHMLLRREALLDQVIAADATDSQARLET